MIAPLLAFAVAAASPSSLTLAQAIDIAVGTDPRLTSANVEVDRARLQTLRANLQRVRATIDANVTGLYDNQDVLSPPATADELPHEGVLGLTNIAGQVSVPLFTGFRISAGIERANQLEAAAGTDVQRERQAVILDVARAYWGARRLTLLERARAAADERLAESEQIVQARVKAGLAAGLDINRAASRRVQLDVERTTLSSQAREAQARFITLLGLEGAVELVDAPPPADTPIEDELALVQRALDARPELRGADLRLAALGEEKRMAQSSYWPQLSVGGLAEVGNNPSVAGAGARAVSASPFPLHVQTGVGLSMNLFDTFDTTTAVDDVAHRQRLLAAERRAFAREVETAVRVAHARVVSLREQRTALVRARDIVNENLGMLQRAYERGDVLFSEVLDEQVELATAERQIVDVDAQLALALVELHVAAGQELAPSKSADNGAQRSEPRSGGGGGPSSGSARDGGAPEVPTRASRAQKSTEKV